VLGFGDIRSPRQKVGRARSKSAFRGIACIALALEIGQDKNGLGQRADDRLFCRSITRDTHGFGKVSVLYKC